MKTGHIKLPHISFFVQHFLRLTDDRGILEHCIFSTPDLTEGYSLDDNARALQLVLRVPNSEKKLKILSQTYLKFIISARTENGFHNDFDQNFKWKNDDGCTEAAGRAMAALGEACVLNLEDEQKLTSAFIFDQKLNLIPKANALRTKSQLIFGLSKRIEFNKKFPHLLEKLELRKKLKGEIFIESNFESEIEKLADSLIESYTKNANKEWKWYESCLTYDNGRLPLGLFVAYLVTGKKLYREIARESLDFLLKITYDQENDCFSFPGYRGWYNKNGEKNLFGQQPIEAGSMAEVCSMAYAVTKEGNYLKYLYKTLSWFIGENIIKTSLINEKTGGIYDGIESWGINPNQGAESIICFLTAYLAAKRLGIADF